MNNAEEEIRKRGETDLQSRDTHQEQKMGARACQRRLLGHVSKRRRKDSFVCRKTFDIAFNTT